LGSARVVIANKSLPASRTAFYEGLRGELGRRGIELQVVYGDAFGGEKLKADSVRLPWGTYRRNRFIHLRSRYLVWQPIRDLLRSSDFVIVEQASKLLLNYEILFRQELKLGPRVGLWGHGHTVENGRASWLGELSKKRYSRLPHWWFAYTNGAAEYVADLGYPRERITVVNNAIDTRSLIREVRAVSDEDLAEFRATTGSLSGMTGLFVGSLYKEKRLEFLLAASERIAREYPGFVLLIAGDGPDRPIVEQYARTHPWVHFLGRVDGARRATALRAADLVLMPGRVGLVILDAFAAEAPLITTGGDFHSPEIEYLVDGENGICVQKWQDPDEYASAIIGLLQDGERLTQLRDACRTAAQIYTNEEMITRFANGVEDALGAPSF
jgi:glycosyltransferase involved in cell wall biosynthesis